jgi:hypothetical protein
LIDADLKLLETVWGKASHASADPKEIANDEYAAKISTCKHRKCRECPLPRVYKQAAQKQIPHR